MNARERRISSLEHVKSGKDANEREREERTTHGLFFQDAINFFVGLERD